MSKKVFLFLIFKNIGGVSLVEYLLIIIPEKSFCISSIMAFSLVKSSNKSQPFQKRRRKKYISKIFAYKHFSDFL